MHVAPIWVINSSFFTVCSLLFGTEPCVTMITLLQCPLLVVCCGHATGRMLNCSCDEADADRIVAAVVVAINGPMYKIGLCELVFE